jgi:hypothetical protein
MSLPDWDFAKLEELIESRGDDVILETGVACTCRREDALASGTLKDHQPAAVRRMTCNDCQGDGFIYRNARCIKGLITSIQAGPNRKLLEGGYAVAGDAVFSPSLHAGRIGDFDRITFTYSEFVGDGQIIMRNAAHSGENKDRRIGVAKNEDRLWYQADCAIWCEDDNHVLYVQNEDFVLEGKVIRWIGKKPNNGVFYTLKYTAFLEWIVYNTPLARIDQTRNLAQRVLIRKKHVAFHTGSFADTPVKRQEEQDRLTTRVKI